MIKSTFKEIELLNKKIDELYIKIDRERREIDKLDEQLSAHLENRYNEIIGKKFGELCRFRVRITDSWIEISFHYKHIYGLDCEENFSTKLFDNVSLTIWSTEDKNASSYPAYSAEMRDELVGFFKNELCDIPQKYKGLK